MSRGAPTWRVGDAYSSCTFPVPWPPPCSIVGCIVGLLRRVFLVSATGAEGGPQTEHACPQELAPFRIEHRLLGPCAIVRSTRLVCGSVDTMKWSSPAGRFSSSLILMKLEAAPAGADARQSHATPRLGSADRQAEVTVAVHPSGLQLPRLFGSMNLARVFLTNSC